MIEDLLIVAAGMGTRLRAKGNLKPLVEVGGVPLIDRALEAAFAAGVTQATVVTGYHADLLETHLMVVARRRGWRIETVRNMDYLRPNGLSVLAAREHLQGRFFLAMCDHMVDPVLYRRLNDEAGDRDSVTLGVDCRLDNPLVDLEDVTKVQVRDGAITGIGKQLTHYNAFDTGVFAAGPALFEAIEMAGSDTGDYSISAGMQLLAREGRALAADVGDAFWIDVDSPEMHRLASAHLMASQRATV